MRISTATARKIALLQFIMNARTSSRSALVSQSGLSAASVTRLVDELAGGGLVEEGGKLKSGSRVGPKRRALRVRPDAACAIGMDVDYGLCVRGVLIDAANTARMTQRTDLGPGTQPVHEAVKTMAERLVRAARRQELPLLGLGLGLPFHFDHGLTAAANWDHFDELSGLAGHVSELKQTFDVDVETRNTVHCAALAESRIGPHADAPDMLLVMARAGVACAMIQNHALMPLDSRKGGELGHTVVQPEGRFCSCGNRGCLEAYAGGRALVSTLLEKREGGLPAASSPYAFLVDQVRRDSPDVRDALRLGARYLGIGVQNMVQVLAPQVVLIEGFYAIAAPEIQTMLRSLVQPALSERTGTPRENAIFFNGLGEFAGAIGAAMHVRDRAARHFFARKLAEGGGPEANLSP